jgi:uncharacterized protein (TIGR02996 family)
MPPAGPRPLDPLIPAVHPERDALLQAVIDNLQDDTPRLVYADWQDEHGQPEHAELIRLQCELARLIGVRGQAARRAEVLARVKGLRKRPGFAVGRKPYFWRGFYERLRLHWKAPPARKDRRPFDTVGPGSTDLAERVPFDRVLTLDVKVLDGPDTAPLDELAAAEWFGRVAVLILGDGGPSAVYDRTALAPLIASPRLGNLRYLTIYGAAVDAAALADLVLAKPAVRLRHVRLMYGSRVRPDAAALAAALRRLGRARPPRLEHIMLDTPDFTDPAAEAILRSPWLRKLHFRGSFRHLSAPVRERFAAQLDDRYVDDDDSA